MRVVLCCAVMLAAAAAQAQNIPDPCPNAQPVPQQLHLPRQLPPGEPVQFEKQILAYLNTLSYRKLGWCEDKGVRDTGPYVKADSVIVHPPVHIYYSPEVSRWLLNGRQGPIPDGAVIIKEQFSPAPAARYQNIPLSALGCSNDWTIMIKNSAASRDGWFWAEVWNNPPMDFTNKFQYPNAGYGLYCLRCHASAEKELTFASLSNIQGAPGWPLQYRVDDSWRSIPSPHPLVPRACGAGVSLAEATPDSPFPEHAKNATLDLLSLPVNKRFLLVRPLTLQKMPSEQLDDTLAPPAAAVPAHSLGFVTSSQCLGCHSGLSNSGLGPSMVLLPAAGTASGTPPPAPVNVSPYGEWRWSPMGLAGRDPVFYSQLDSELAFLKTQPKRQMVVNTCMTCHGAMGKQTFAAEHPDQDFNMDFVYDTDVSSEGFRYGSLARDGISCMVCHRMAAPKDPSLPYFLANHINGIFDLTPAGELNGPFQDNVVTTYPMDTSLGVKPRYNPYIQSAQMCGSCHTILLPVVDSSDPDAKSVEQDTYPEWLNSAYRNEYGSVGATPKTCQDCHMPTGYANAHSGMNVPVIQDRIAIVQDLTFPQTEHLATPDQLNVRFRTEGFRRHELLGTNGFLLQMFQQPMDTRGNNDILGVRELDYMTGYSTDLQSASNNVVQQAQSITATVAISKWQVTPGKLIVEVTVTNLAGHRFPSGVGFRRAFLELQATMNGKPFWSSGTTDDRGRITDFSGKILPTESFAGGQYQPHFSQSNPISNSSQVQIYEELVQDANHQFTTSFTRRDFDIKDNRLLPIGWSLHGPAGLNIPEPYLHATLPVGDALKDPVYLAGKGQSIVRYEIPLPAGATAANIKTSVALYTQTLPPYFLADRSQTRTPATARLQYLEDSLKDLATTDYANWKLLIASASK